MEITLKIDSRSKQAKAFLAYLKTLPFIKVQTSRYNKETETAIRDAKTGETTSTTLSDFRKSLYA